MIGRFDQSFWQQNLDPYDRRIVDDVFSGNTANYRFCSAEILQAFSCFNVVKTADEAGDTARLRKHRAKVIHRPMAASGRLLPLADANSTY